MMNVIRVSLLLLATHIPILMANSVPAFLWSSHQFANNRMDESVNYQTISSRDLARSVLSEAGWSNLLCSEKKLEQPVDLALVFVGRELLSSDVSSSKSADPALVNLLKAFHRSSNFSMAFPYVAASEDEPIEKSLLLGFAESCQQDFGVDNVAFSESCFVEGESLKKLADVHAVHDHLLSRQEKRLDGLADLVVFCHGAHSTGQLEKPQAESEVLSELISSVERLGSKYVVLYVSDPFRSIQYPSYREIERFLAESNAGNVSLDSTTCDEVCKIKSSLLEGVLVGIVLLMILIFGLCCMMGIDTPTRFEAPQDS